MPDQDWVYPCGQINFPSLDTTYIRKIEWKHLLPKAEVAHVTGTLITDETPFSPDEPDDYEYPMPHRAAKVLYRRYRSLAKRDRHLVICGRLGHYRYYDMDRAIMAAFKVFEGL
jgi:UDP-galactopyranose mutase